MLVLLLLPLLGSTVLSACGADAPPDPPVDPRAQGPLFQLADFRDTAPATFRARFETTEGDFVIEVHRDWAPLGADRFYNLVKGGWYDGVRLHRVLADFTAGWGIHDDPYVNFVWQKQTLADDPVIQSNTRGRVSFAKAGPNSRTTGVFVNYKTNAGLDERGFAPFGQVVEGMEVVDALYSVYGDGPPRGEGVYQAMAIAKGAEYFDEEFPLLDRIDRATLVDAGPDAGSDR